MLTSEELILLNFDNASIRRESLFILVANATGKKYVIRKTTLIWMLFNDNTCLSTDRLSRAKVLILSSHPNKLSRTVVSVAEKGDTIIVGDRWLLSFAYLSGTISIQKPIC